MVKVDSTAVAAVDLTIASAAEPSLHHHEPAPEPVNRSYLDPALLRNPETTDETWEATTGPTRDAQSTGGTTVSPSETLADFRPESCEEAQYLQVGAIAT